MSKKKDERSRAAFPSHKGASFALRRRLPRRVRGKDVFVAPLIAFHHCGQDDVVVKYWLEQSGDLFWYDPSDSKAVKHVRVPDVAAQLQSLQVELDAFFNMKEEDWCIPSFATCGTVASIHVAFSLCSDADCRPETRTKVITVDNYGRGDPPPAFHALDKKIRQVCSTHGGAEGNLPVDTMEPVAWKRSIEMIFHGSAGAEEIERGTTTTHTYAHVKQGQGCSCVLL
jgi:hypothetical protein